jgi:hypothetical protein
MRADDATARTRPTDAERRRASARLTHPAGRGCFHHARPRDAWRCREAAAGAVDLLTSRAKHSGACSTRGAGARWLAEMCVSVR